MTQHSPSAVARNCAREIDARLHDTWSDKRIDIIAPFVQSALDYETAKYRITLLNAKAVIDEQAESAGLWFVPVYITEDILQKALRRLHAVIEGKSPEECARAAIAAATTTRAPR